jgi:nitrite reductase/ring-hydroxylating ferredoxin subunit
MSNGHFISQQINQLSIITQHICHSTQLSELGKIAFTVLYRGQVHPAIVIRFRGQVYAYLNQCLYSGKRLDSDDEYIFDQTEHFLRASDSGICYSPVTGEGYSPICMGQTLTPLRVEEIEGSIYLKDKHANLYYPDLIQLTLQVAEQGYILLFQEEYSSISNATS